MLNCKQFHNKNTSKPRLNPIPVAEHNNYKKSHPQREHKYLHVQDEIDSKEKINTM